MNEFSLEGKVYNLNVEEIYPNHEYLMIRVQSTGKLKISN